MGAMTYIRALDKDDEEIVALLICGDKSNNSCSKTSSHSTWFYFKPSFNFFRQWGVKVKPQWRQSMDKTAQSLASPPARMIGTLRVNIACSGARRLKPGEKQRSSVAKMAATLPPSPALISIRSWHQTFLQRPGSVLPTRQHLGPGCGQTALCTIMGANQMETEAAFTWRLMELDQIASNVKKSCHLFAVPGFAKVVEIFQIVLQISKEYNISICNIYRQTCCNVWRYQHRIKGAKR